MQEFTIIIEEKLKREVKITAEDEVQALSQVMEEYHEGKIVLDCKDFTGNTDFKWKVPEC